MDDSQVLPKLSDEAYSVGWRSHFSLKENRPYFFNIQTKESKWDIPIVEESTILGESFEDTEAQTTQYSPENKPPEPTLQDDSRRLGKPDQRPIIEFENRFPLVGKRHVVVKLFKGVPYINIREYHCDGTKNKLLSGKKGINLRTEEWRQLYEQKDLIHDSIRKLKDVKIRNAFGKPEQRPMGESEICFSIGGKRRVVIKCFRGSPYVNIREYYSHGGDKQKQLLPGKKGITLREDEWIRLYKQMELIKSAVETLKRPKKKDGHTQIDTMKNVVEFIFAAMLDAIVNGWLKENCEGCLENYPSQLDHACLNYGYIENLNDAYFKDFHHLIQDEWVVGAAREYLNNTIDVNTLKTTVENIRKQWGCTPQLACDAMEKSKLEEIVRDKLQTDFVARWLGQVDYNSIEISYTL